METEIFDIVLLALIQGVTEFLPISSSGHLAIGQVLIGPRQPDLQLTIVLHMGTLLAIVTYYCRDLVALVRPGNRRVLFLVIFGTLPIIIAGVMLRGVVAEYFQHLWFTAAGLGATGIMLIFLHNEDAGPTSLNDMNSATALTIGFFQCLAIVPGVSRSGSTIAIATRLGMTPDAAATYTFFLAIPAIAGAGITCFTKAAPAEEMTDIATLSLPLQAVGLAVSFGVGLLALMLLLKILKRGKLHYFGYYCLTLSVIIFIIEFAR